MLSLAALSSEAIWERWRQDSIDAKVGLHNPKASQDTGESFYVLKLSKFCKLFVASPYETYQTYKTLESIDPYIH